MSSAAAILISAVSFAAAAGSAGTDPDTGLVLDEGFVLVRAFCTGCHSARLVIQNRADAEGWRRIIAWMQAEQGLAPLGQDEAPIVAYLARNYGPRLSGRRKPLPEHLRPELE